MSSPPLQGAKSGNSLVRSRGEGARFQSTVLEVALPWDYAEASCSQIPATFPLWAGIAL